MHFRFVSVAGVYFAALAAAAPWHSDFPYLGCYEVVQNVHNGFWYLEKYANSWLGMKLSTEQCHQACTTNENDFNLFATALQGCFCGYCTYENIKVTTESNCNINCEAERGKKCGGAKGDSIYVSLYGDKKSVPPPGYITGLTHPTCYSYGDSALKGPSYTNSTEMTVNSCTEFCVQQHNMKTMILVKGDTCYCSNSLPTEDTSLAGCDAPCKGDKRQKCGGGNNGAGYMSVWTLAPS